ncbi:MAG: hypothetical protein ACJA1B_003087, partial [Polaribacter sp.]
MILNGTGMKIRWAKQEELTGIVGDFSKIISPNSQLLIENVRTEYRVLRVRKEVFFPVTINHTEWENSFVCGPYAAYTAYAKEEIKWNIDHKTVRAILILLVNTISGWLKRGMLNKNVHVNNFLMTTNPYPEWNGKEITEITSFIKAQYPKHAIIFRSLNDYQHGHLLQLFQKNKYENVGSRQVYIFNLTKEAWLKHRNNKHDNKLIEKKGLHLINHKEMKAYLPQALQLYRDLYLKKYSELNPQLTLKYFEEVH